MSKRKLFIVILFAVIAGLTAYWAVESRQETLRAMAEAAVGAPLLRDFEMNAPQEIILRSHRGQTTLVLNQQGVWNIVERNNYPARTDLVSNLLFMLSRARISETVLCPKTRLPKLELALPPLSVQMDSGRVRPVAEAPLSIDFLTGGGERLTSTLVCGGVILPKDAEINPEAKLLGRHYLINDVPYTVCLSSETLTNVSAMPQTWLDKNFVKIGDITAITFAPAPGLHRIGWTLEREDPGSPFFLRHKPDTARFDADTADTASFFLKALAFEDVKPISEFSTNGLSKLTVMAADSLIYQFSFFDDPAVSSFWTTLSIKRCHAGSLPTEVKTPMSNWAFLLPRSSFARLLKSRQEWFIATDTQFAMPDFLPEIFPR